MATRSNGHILNPNSLAGVPQARRLCLFRLRLFVWKPSTGLWPTAPSRWDSEGMTRYFHAPVRLDNRDVSAISIMQPSSLQRIIGAVPDGDQEHAARQVWSHHTPDSSSIGNVPSQIFVHGMIPAAISEPYRTPDFASKVGLCRVIFNCFKLK